MRALRVAVFALIAVATLALAGCGKPSAGDSLKANIKAAQQKNKEAYLQTISKRHRADILDDLENNGDRFWLMHVERFANDAVGTVTIVSEENQENKTIVCARIGDWSVVAVLVNEDGWKVDSIKSQ
ncbi:MAG TPA: hypothetical protein VM141_09315 [Planctomycetota bacterium]|nr:hypothetical protein [Planctomycetota bacterium]